MFLYDLGDSTILTREEEGRLSNIFQKGLAVETCEAGLWDQLQRRPTHADLAEALTDNLHGLSQQQLHQVLYLDCNHCCYCSVNVKAYAVYTKLLLLGSNCMALLKSSCIVVSVVRSLTSRRLEAVAASLVPRVVHCMSWQQRLRLLL